MSVKKITLESIVLSGSIAKAATLVGLCVLVGGFARPAHATHRCEDYGLKPVGLFAEGQPAEEFIAETREKAGGVAAFLRSLGITELDEDNLADLLQQINKDPTLLAYGNYTIPEALKGIGGISTIILLQRLFFIDGKPIATKVVYGKIRDYTFIDETKRGHLSVDVCTDDRQTGERELFHWDVEVLGDVKVPGEGFTVIPRDDTKPNDPFSLLPDFQMPDAALDATNPHSIWARGLDHKLGAKGIGIKVRNVYHRKLSNAIRPRLERLDSMHHYYKSTPDSCIDLFTRGYPPATFGELVGNDYCLGRCAQPAIYNSGD